MYTNRWVSNHDLSVYRCLLRSMLQTSIQLLWLFRGIAFPGSGCHFHDGTVPVVLAPRCVSKQIRLRRLTQETAGRGSNSLNCQQNEGITGLAATMPIFVAIAT